LPKPLSAVIAITFSVTALGLASMNETRVSPTAKPRKKSRLRRWLRRLGLLIVGLIILVVALAVYHRTIGGNRLAAAVTATDRDDPGWQWEDLSAYRGVVPDAQNAAPVVLEAAKLLPENWLRPPPSESPFGNTKSILDRVRDLESAEQLDADLIKAMRDEVQKVKPALAAARRLGGFRTGR
jgi:hypothetical protein